MRVLSVRTPIAVVGALAAGLLLTACEQSKKGSGPPKGETPEVAVIVVQPERVTVSAELPGRTSPCLVAEVRPQVNGIVQNRLFVEGSDVRAGEVLYQIDPALYQAAYDTAAAGLAKAEANLKLTELRAKRNRSLVATGAASQEEFDNAEAAYLQARADVAFSSATLASTRVNLGFTRIKAPISGRIGKSDVTVGALATAHQGPPFTTIQQLDPMFVDVTQSSSNLLRIRRNILAGRIKGDQVQTNVRLILEDGTPYAREGTLKFSDVTVDPSTGSFIVRIVFPNPDHVLLPGMYVRAIIEEGVNEKAILVPQRAVSRDTKGNPTVLVVDGTDKAQRRILKVDRAIGDSWLVSEGLNAGDRVIMEGLQQAKSGSAVKVVPFRADRETTPSVAAERPAAGDGKGRTR